MILRLLVWAAAACVLSAATDVAAQTRAITLAWDPTPDSQVAGYIVYVGTSPGTYSEAIDVRRQTTFTYLRPQPRHTYYFAVAAYANGPLVGQLSPEVVAPGSGTGGTDAAASADVEVCGEQDPQDCLTATPIFQSGGRIQSPAVTLDRRLFFVDQGRTIRIVGQGTAVALEAPPGVLLSGLELDPLFQTTRHVWVAEITSGRDGRELSVVRYREVSSRLGEPSRVIAALPIPNVDRVPFALDAAGRIYIAVPGGAAGRRGPYDGMILRFERDGSVPNDSPAMSPIFASGYDAPMSMMWDASAARLRVAAAGGDTYVIGAVGTGTAAGVEWPRIPVPERFSGERGAAAGALPALTIVPAQPVVRQGGIYLGAAAEYVYRLRTADDRTVAVQTYWLGALGNVTDVAAAENGGWYAVVSGSGEASRIVMMRPQ